MNKNSLTLQTDVSFLLLTVLIFFGYIISAADYGNIVRNGIFMCITVVVILFAYFMTLPSTLTVCAVAVFMISGYMTYNALRNGDPISIYDIFWVLWIPILTITLWNFMRNQRMFRKVCIKLSDELNKLSGTDPLTQFKNTKAFINDCTVYMKISKRYNMNLCIIVVQLRYWDVLKRKLGKKRGDIIIKRISENIGKALRSEDSIFITNQNPYNWCVLLYTTEDKLDIIRKRITASVDAMDIQDIATEKVSLELAFGEAQYDLKRECNVMEFLNYANMDLKLNLRRLHKKQSDTNSHKSEADKRTKLEERN